MSWQMSEGDVVKEGVLKISSGWHQLRLAPAQVEAAAEMIVVPAQTVAPAQTGTSPDCGTN